MRRIGFGHSSASCKLKADRVIAVAPAPAAQRRSVSRTTMNQALQNDDIADLLSFAVVGSGSPSVRE
jgi:hypothetical protein